MKGWRKIYGFSSFGFKTNNLGKIFIQRISVLSGSSDFLLTCTLVEQIALSTVVEACVWHITHKAHLPDCSSILCAQNPKNLVFHFRRAWCFGLVLQLELFRCRDVAEKCFMVFNRNENGKAGKDQAPSPVLFSLGVKQTSYFSKKLPRLYFAVY